MVVVCETKLATVNKMKEVMPGYDLLDRCVKVGKGGLVIGVKKNTFGSFINVTSSNRDDIAAGRISLGDRGFRIITCHAPQEDDLKDVREEFFEDLSIEIDKSKLAGEECVVIGDLNSKIDIDDAGDIYHETANGKLLLNMVRHHDLEVVNFSNKCTGKWTHVIRTSGKESQLDYAIASCGIFQKIESMTIDETCLFCPFSLKKYRGEVKRQYSDHNSIILEISVPRGGTREMKKDGVRKWKMTEEKLLKFQELTDKRSDKSEASEKSDYDTLETYMLDCMNECFDVISPKRNYGRREESNKYRETVKSLMAIYKQGKTQRAVVKSYLDILTKQKEDEVAERQSNALADRIRKLTVDDKLSMDAFWKLKKSYVNQSSLLSSVVNEQGIEVFGTSAILHEYRNEFEKRLTPSPIDVELKQFEELTLKLSEMCVEMSCRQRSKDFTEEELDEAIKQLNKGKSCPDEFPPEVFIYGGQELRKFILEVVNLVKNDQKIPPKWAKFKITTLYKKKGSLKKLVNQRGIFLTPVIAKIFEKLIKKRINGHLTNVSIWQAGSKSKRSPADQTFLLRGAINHAVYLNKPLFLTFYDFRQCFDKIWLEDSLLSLWKVGVKDDMLKMISILNEKSEGTVKTMCGETDVIHLGPNAKQGTVLGPILSSSSIAECCEEQKKGGANIGAVVLRSLAYVDDLLGANHKVGDVHDSHKVVIRFSKKKRIPLNEEKCIILPVNVSVKEAVPVLLVNGKEMKICSKERYLGDIFNSKGDNNDLVDDRVQKGMACMISSISLASEITLGVHLIQSLVFLYKVVFVQVVTFNSCSWNNITKSQIAKLQTVQLKFLKRILHAPSSATNCFVFLELGIVPIIYNIHMAQLNYLHHILTLENSDPVQQSYHQQKMFPFENNWFNEVSDLRERYGLTENDVEISLMSKERWKSIVTKSVFKFALNCLIEENSQKTKTSHHPAPNKLHIQDYFLHLRPADARLLFSIRCGTLDLKMLRRYQYDDGDCLCRLCGKEEETVFHIVNRCEMITRTVIISDIYSTSKDDVEAVVARVKEFLDLAQKKKDREEEDNCTQ